MKYMLLLYQDRAFEREWESTSAQEQARVRALFGRFAELAGDRILGGEELGLSHTATTIRKTSDTATDGVVTDGPFAEVAEHIGGYFVIEAADLDEAVELAQAVPVSIVEVRPIVEEEDGI